MLCCITGSWAAQWRGPPRSLLQGCVQRMSWTVIPRSRPAQSRSAVTTEVESFGEREAGAVGERESVRFRQGPKAGDLDAVGVGEWFENQWAVACLEVVGYLLRVAAVGGHLRQRLSPVDHAHGCGCGDRVDGRV